MSVHKKALQVDTEVNINSYNSSLETKFEQQKALEKILLERGILPDSIADIACGGGGTTVHLAELYPSAKFTLIDENEDAISIARQATDKWNATCDIGDLYDLQLESDSFDLVICWQTLSWLDRPEAALKELVRICKPSGTVLASSLFNLNHDVDVYSKVIDHTFASSHLGLYYAYNTYSERTVRLWLSALATDVTIHKFSIPIDLVHSGKGTGTYTKTLDTGERLQFSAGMHLNWGLLEVNK